MIYNLFKISVSYVFFYFCVGLGLMMWKTVFNESIKNLLHLVDKVSIFLFVFFLIFSFFFCFLNEQAGTNIVSFVRQFWTTFSHQWLVSLV